jgi:hypothetical protein
MTMMSVLQQSNIDMAIKPFTTIDEVVILQKKAHELLLTLFFGFIFLKQQNQLKILTIKKLQCGQNHCTITYILPAQ